MSKKNYNRLPHDVVDSDVEFYLFENQKTIASEIGAFSVSVLGDRKGQSVTIEHIRQMSNAARSLTPPGRDMQRVLVLV